MILDWWHNYLGMEKFDEAWHRHDMLRELKEFQEATVWFHKWSELSDVVYTFTRATRYSKVSLVFPLGTWQYVIGIMYMIPKYMSRWWLFRAVGKEFGVDMRCVRNPQKREKLRTIANEYNIPPEAFIAAVEKQLRWWIIIP